MWKTSTKVWWCNTKFPKQMLIVSKIFCEIEYLQRNGVKINYLAARLTSTISWAHHAKCRTQHQVNGQSLWIHLLQPNSHVKIYTHAFPNSFALLARCFIESASNPMWTSPVYPFKGVRTSSHGYVLTSSHWHTLIACKKEKKGKCHGIPSMIAIVAGQAPCWRTMSSTAVAVERFCG